MAANENSSPNVLRRLLSVTSVCILHSVGFHFFNHCFKKTGGGVPVVVQWLTNPTRNHEVAGLAPALAYWVKDPALP